MTNETTQTHDQTMSQKIRVVIEVGDERVETQRVTRDADDSVLPKILAEAVSALDLWENIGLEGFTCAFARGAPREYAGSLHDVIATADLAWSAAECFEKAFALVIDVAELTACVENQDLAAALSVSRGMDKLRTAVAQSDGRVRLVNDRDFDAIWENALKKEGQQ